MTNMQALRLDRECRICKSTNIVTVMKLRDTPLGDQFVTKEQAQQSQPTFPLELAICESCGYVHLPYSVNPELSYANYVYESAVTVGLRNHFDAYANEMAKGFGIEAGSLIVDLGSNDGSMLSSFKRLGMKVLGVEPAKAIAERATYLGIPTISNYFTETVASQIIGTYGKPAVITANYMLANIDDVVNFTKLVALLIERDGIFVIETGYHPEQMKVNMFDYIYHEHFSYFTAAVLKYLVETAGFELIQLIKTAPKGGSIRAVSQLKGAHRAVDPAVTRTLKEEAEAKMNDKTTYFKFAHEIDLRKQIALGKLREYKNQGKRLAGFGASHSTTTLIYHFELREFLDYIVDDNPLKYGKFSPGYHIPVFPASSLLEDKPDIVVILAWQHTQSILQRHNDFLEANGTFVVLLPEFKIFSA